MSSRVGEHLVAVENTPQTHNMVVCTLCSCYPWDMLGLPPVWYKSAPYRSRAVKDPRGVLRRFRRRAARHDTEIRVWDSTAETRFLVLPMRPAGTEGWSEERLAELVTRDSHDRHRPAEGAVRSKHMDSIHDMGGMDGFGKVEVEQNEPAFHAEWEGRVLALQRAMGYAGAWHIDHVALRAGAAAAGHLSLVLLLRELDARRWNAMSPSAGLRPADESKAGQRLRSGEAAAAQA